ncbi:c-type cytochrome [Methylococcus sp. EFPC2]|uniref:c-type cytochrome n=1 Tax=Methylococcus sp. EFPC2 TaxID=2812648 RepID=UPI0019677B46|nr:cytochrome c [Methylococcus sp. EFPC2]QSA95908.1 cytochrome c [Methylococcus sp. EFPC2]
MSTPKPRVLLVLGGLALTAGAQGQAPEGPHLGIPASPSDIAAWNMTVYPDGQGLPPGRGKAADGKTIYEHHCGSCHGPKGAGGSAEELAGGTTENLKGPHPDKTIGAYWPYATTVFDFVRRSMPLDAPGSLTTDQIYAVTAYLLHINGLIEENAEIGPQNLAKVQMPNREGFEWVDIKR